MQTNSYSRNNIAKFTFAFLLCGLPCTLFAQTEDSQQQLLPHHRALCVGIDCVLETSVTDEQIPIPFGTLFKIGIVDKSRCLVYNLQQEGWIESKHLVLLSHPNLLDAIERSKTDRAQKEFALGSYFLRRNLADARSHLEAAVGLDPAMQHAWANLLFVYESIGDENAAFRALEKLRSFPEQRILVMSRDVRSTNDLGVLERCNNLAEKDSYLKADLAIALLNRGDPISIVEAHKLADAAYRLQPQHPSRAFTAAQSCQALIDNDDDETLKAKTLNMALAFMTRTVSLDHFSSIGFENLAYIKRQTGDHGPAIRLAQHSLRLNPRAIGAAELIGSYADQAERGVLFKDAKGTPIQPDDIFEAREIARGLQLIKSLDLPLEKGKSHPEEENLRLNGGTAVTAGRLHDTRGRNALHLLVENRNFICLYYLAQHYFLDWSDQNADGKTPLHIAVASENLALIATLVRCGADVTVKDRNGLSVIMAASQSNGEPVLSCLLKAEMLDDEIVREVCSAYKLDSKTTVDDLRQHVVAKAVLSIQEIIQHVVLADANLYSVAMNRLTEVRAGLNQKKMVVILDNSPILIPGELDSDRADFPVRARVRLIRMLEQQVEETVAARVGQEILELEDENRLADEIDLLRRRVIAEADTAIYMAQICLPPESFAEFRQSTGRQLQDSLMKAGIRWTLPPAP